MKRLAFCLSLVLLGGGVCHAEKSGEFVGFELGSGSARIWVDAMDAKYSGSARAALAYYGLNVGYKHFFAEPFGVRAYANLGFANSFYNISQGTGSNFNRIAIFNVGVNADALLTVYRVQNVDLGAFVGLGAGMDANRVVSKDIGGARRCAALARMSKAASAR